MPPPRSASTKPCTISATASDFIVVKGNQCAVAFARVLGDKVGNHSVLETVGANLTGITGQQAHVETREREFEKKRLCAHG